MCGITGYICRKADNSQNQIFLNASLDSLRYRGPDGRGKTQFNLNNLNIGFGHTRLSILDLTENGSQPMTSQNKRFCITFNGEIYNFVEIRHSLENKGYVFKTQSDTEVLLEAWSHWGEKCLEMLNGMFAFAIFDKELNKITLVRDHFGIKPIYYAFIDGNFYFASTLPALNKQTGMKLMPCMETGLNYVVNGTYGKDENTFFQNAKQLMPGKLIEIDLTKNLKQTVSKWWDPSTEIQNNVSLKEASETVKEMFLENLKQNLRSDVPCGAALSGGLDSSAIVSGIREIYPEIQIDTFSYIADDEKLNEEKWINIVNQEKRTKENKIHISDNDLIDDLDDMILCQGEPFGSAGIYAQYKVYKRVKEAGITVLLDGQGADEIFCGYHGYPLPRIISLSKSFNIFKVFSFIKNWSNHPGRDLNILIKEILSNFIGHKNTTYIKKILGKKQKYMKSGYISDEFINHSFSHNYTKKNNSNRQLMQHLKAVLQGDGLGALLRHGDRNSMRWSVESRVPFLNANLAEYVLSLPEEYLISHDGISKYIFKEAMKEIVPESIINRNDKIGFEPPEKKWLHSNLEKASNILKKTKKIPFFDPEIASNLMTEMGQNSMSFDSRFIWRVINYTIWYELHIEGKL